MNKGARQTLPEQSLEQAAEWFVELNESPASLEARAQFDEWLRSSPKHLWAYLKIAGHWDEVVAGTARAVEPVDELIAMAREEENVSRLFDEARQAPSDRKSSRRRRGVLVALAASVVLSVIAGLVTWTTLSRGVYSTGIGEQRSIALPDGSMVELNTRSRIRVRYSEASRRIDLLEGQALFSVARSADRPFVVHSAGARVQAVGTQFDVYRKPGGTTVTVLEGRVAVSASRAKSPILGPGQQLVVTTERITEPRTVNPAAATAWTQRRLVFSATPLAEVVEEFNRYNRMPLVITDPALGDTEVSGSFSSGDPGALLRFLQEVGGCRVEETGRAIYIHGE